MASQNAPEQNESDSGPTARSPWTIIARVIDFIIVFCIALEQIVLSLAVLFLQFLMAYGGGFDPIVTPFALCGLVGAGILFSCRFWPRIIAFAWQGILVTALVARTNPASGKDVSYKTIAFWLELGMLYLCLTAGMQFYKRKTRT